jgi:predicted kinase
MEEIIFAGIQGSGKTTFYRQRFADTHVRISLDMVKTRQRERKLIETCLDTGQPFVVDNTNVLAAERAAYIALAKAADFRIIGYYFLPNLRRALKWNTLREKREIIPVPGVIGTLKRLEPPTPAEGFDQLYVVDVDSENRFIVSDWTPEAVAR